MSRRRRQAHHNDQDWANDRHARGVRGKRTCPRPSTSQASAEPLDDMKSGPKLSASLLNAAVQQCRCSGGVLSCPRLVASCLKQGNRTGEPAHDPIRCGAGTMLEHEAAEDESNRSSEAAAMAIADE